MGLLLGSPGCGSRADAPSSSGAGSGGEDGATEVTLARETSHSSDAPGDGTCIAVSHSWSFAASGSPDQGGEIRYCIPEPEHDRAVENFGVDPAALSFEYSSRKELDRLVARRAPALAERGFLLERRGEEVQVTVDYVSLVRDSAEPLASLRLALDAAAPPGDSLRARLDFYAGFVQSLDLVVPARERVTPSGRRLVVAGTLHPLETVVAGRGDCDGLTMAFAALARGHSKAPLVLLGTEVEGSRHLFAAAAAEPREGDLVVEVEGRPMVVYELTSRSPSRPISARARKALLGKEVEVFPIRP